MATYDIHKARVRDALPPRREPYWGASLAAGLFLGFRRLDAGGTWIARQREDRRQHYQSLGDIRHKTYDEAAVEARTWARNVLAGEQVREVKTVTDACRAYVEDRRREKGEAAAHDAHQRLSRTVYGHRLGKVTLDKLRSVHIKDEFYNCARAARDAWLHWPSRVGPMIAADLGLEADCVTDVLTRHVHDHIAQLVGPALAHAPR